MPILDIYTEKLKEGSEKGIWTLVFLWFYSQQQEVEGMFTSEWGKQHGIFVQLSIIQP